jgi:predicted acylesterase/phospholipase RssA
MCAQVCQSFNQNNSIKKVILDFQGGGAYGAYSAGVAKQFLADPDIRIVGAQGTSAGAMTSCIIADAINSCDTYEEGRKLAIQNLDKFWDHVVEESAPNMTVLNNMQRFMPVQGANMPILHFLSSLSNTFNMHSHDSYPAAVAVKTLHRIVAKVLTSDGNHLPFVSSGRFVKASVNTSRELENGRLENVTHTGEDVTMESLLASAALKGLFAPLWIKDEKHWDGGYTVNGCLDVKPDKLPPHHGLIVIGTNRPASVDIAPQRQLDILPLELRTTRGLVLHQMYDEVVLRAQRPREEDDPTIHLITHNHDVHHDWTAKQNTSHWHIEMLKAHGAQDGKNALQEFKHKIGIENTVSKEKLEAIARGEDIKPDIHPLIAVQKQPQIALPN